VRRLVFVEGFPGAGKSTTAQFLARLLARQGEAVRWVYEEETPHPFVPPPPAGGHRSWASFADARVAQWRAFAAAAADMDVTVVPEGALLQLPVLSMLTRNAEAAAIEDLVRRLVDAVAPLHPRLVYLARAAPEAAFRALAERRGAAWLLAHVQRSAGSAFAQARGLSGFEGLLAYWRAHAELCDALVERLPLPRLVLEVGPDGWDERRQRVCAFTEIPYEVDPDPTAADAARVAGRYGDGRREVTIEVVDGRLVLRGVLWPTNALLAVRRNVFDMESWPLRLVFEEDAGGTIRAFRWTGARLSWGGPRGEFARRL
jgi:hypothetical protein